MRALADTAGMTTPERAAFWLEKLAADKHKGRHDTWTAARERAAKSAGVELTIAKRIWQRWQFMNDVAGTPLLKLMLAYESLCERIENSAAAMRAERLNQGNGNGNAVVSSASGLAARMVAEEAPKVGNSEGAGR